MSDRPRPPVDDDGFFGRPSPRGGVSTRGALISVVIPMLALAALAGFVYDLGWVLPERLSGSSGLVRALWWGGAAVQWFAIFAAGFHLSLVSGILYETRRARGLVSREARRIMVTLTRKSWPARIVATAMGRHLLAGLAAIVASAYLSSTRPLAVLAFNIAFLVFAMIRINTPPVAVFLGTSDAADLDWHWALLNVARPLRVVSCLDVRNAEAPWKSRDLTFDCFRSTEEGWWDLVQVLLFLTPLVVIDATVVTPALAREARSLLDSGYAFKCIALVGPDGERGLLDEVGVPKGFLCAVPDGTCLELVTGILARGDFPTPERPASVVAAEMNRWFLAFMEQPEAGQAGGVES